MTSSGFLHLIDSAAWGLAFQNVNKTISCRRRAGHPGFFFRCKTPNKTPEKMLIFVYFFLHLFLIGGTSNEKSQDRLVEPDPNGYVVYCPCMGSFCPHTHILLIFSFLTQFHLKKIRSFWQSGRSLLRRSRFCPSTESYSRLAAMG